MFYHIFLSPQVKQCAIITYKHGIFELPRKLPNDLKGGSAYVPTQEEKKKKDLKILGNIRKVSKLHRTIA